MATTSPTSLKHASWGVTDVAGAPYTGCVVTDWTQTIEAQHQYEYDQNGAVVGDTVYDRRYSVSATLQIPSDITPPTVGSTLAVDGQDYIILSISIVQSNRDYRKATLSLERYGNDVTPSLVGGAASSSAS